MIRSCTAREYPIASPVVFDRAPVGMKIEYSGYNGVDGKKGHEYIRITGEVTAQLEMKVGLRRGPLACPDVFGRLSRTRRGQGMSRIRGVESRLPAAKALMGHAAGVSLISFHIARRRTSARSLAARRTFGTRVVPVGRPRVAIAFSLRIDLQAGVDVDVQLYDLEDVSAYSEGKAIIAWCNKPCNSGLLGMSPTEGNAEYEGLTYKYSGYNGVNGEKGHEYIQIEGVTNRKLVMRAFGYQAGEASVSYTYSEPVESGPSEDQCATGAQNCDAHATCKALVGSFECTCNAGYEGSGQQCSGAPRSAVVVPCAIASPRGTCVCR